MRFQDKVALVTGASGGVGREVVVALAAEGAAVGAVGRDMAALAETVALAEKGGGRALAIAGDVRAAADVQRAVEETGAAFGGLDLLANVAGILRMGAIPDLAEEDWDALFDTHVKACYLTSKHAIPQMRLRGGGAIVNVSSVFAFAAEPGSAAYSASKAAAVALTQIMALDHIGENIRINGVAPGSMRTPMLETVAQQFGGSDPDAFFDAVAQVHPHGRTIDPIEVAKLVLYLMSDDASGIVGANYVIDGGRLAKLGRG